MSIDATPSSSQGEARGVRGGARAKEEEEVSGKSFSDESVTAPGVNRALYWRSVLST